MGGLSATTNAPRLVLAGNDPPRVAFIRDTKVCGDAPERGPGYLFANIEGERTHCGLLPGQAGMIIAVDSRDALDLLRYVLAWPGPGEDGRRPDMDDSGRRVLDLDTCNRVRADALAADDLVFAPFGVGVVTGQMSQYAAQLTRDRDFVEDLDALSKAHSAAFYGYSRSLLAFGYQLARDDRGVRR